MSLYAELLKKFQEKDVPISDRLLIARELFDCPEYCYINRKEELVLDWLLELTKHEMRYEVWLTIRDCLKSKTMKTLKIVDVKSEIKETLVKRLIQSLESRQTLKKKKEKNEQNLVQLADSTKESRLLMECSLLTLENNIFLFYFRKSFADYINLSKMLLKHATENADVETMIRFFKLLVFFRDQNQKKSDLYQSFIDELFFPIIESYCSLKSFLRAHGLEMSDKTLSKGDSKEKIDLLNSELLVLTEQVIFPGFRYKMVNQGLKSLITKHSFDSITPLILCKFLIKHASSQPDVTVHLYALLFEVFVHKSNHNFNLIFHFFVTLCALLGFEVTVERQDSDGKICLLSKDHISNAMREEISYPTEEVSQLALSELLTVLKNEIWILDETINGVLIKQWFEALVVKLGTSPNVMSITYSLMSFITDIHPLIVLPVVKKILTNIILRPKETPEEKKEYRIFFQAIFSMFVKISQVQILIRYYILPVLRQLVEERRLQNSDGLNIVVSDVIPEEIYFGFRNVVGILPSQACISLLRAFTHLLTKEVIEPIETGSIDWSHRLYAELLGNFFAAFLEGNRIAEQSVLQPTWKKFMENFVALRSCLGRFGVALTQTELCSSTLVSFLRICLATGELQLLLILYSPWSHKNEALQLPKAANPNSAKDLQCLMSFLEPPLWNEISQRVMESNDKACQDSLNALLMQELRALILFENCIENSRELQSTISKYLVDSLDSIQLLQKKTDAAVLLPLVSSEKLISIAENIVELHSADNAEVVDLLKHPVVQDNRCLLLSLAWTSMQKIGKLLVKRKRTHSAEVPIPNFRCVVNDVCSSIDFSDMLHLKKKGKTSKKFMKAAKRIDEACNHFLQTDKSEVDGMTLEYDKILRHLTLLQSLPLPFLSQNMQLFLVLGILSVLIVINEFLKKNIEADLIKSSNVKDFCENEVIAVNKISREILVGLLEGPNSLPLLDLVDIKLVLQLLHRDGRCPKSLLHLLFENCMQKTDHLKSLVEGVCLADRYVEENINPNAAPVATLFLQLLQKKYLGNISEDRTLFKEVIDYLLDNISQTINRRMSAQSATEESTFELMDAYWTVLSAIPKRLKAVKPHVVPYVEKFMSCAFSVLQNPEVHPEAVTMAEHLLEAVSKNKTFNGRVAVWKAYKSIRNPQLLAKMLKIAAEKDFIRVMNSLFDTLKPENDCSKEFPYILLTKNLSQFTMPDTKAAYVEKLIVLVSSDASKRIMRGESDDKILDFLSFLVAVARRTKVPLPRELADIILTVTVHALREEPISVEFVATVGFTVIRLLLMMMMNHFPLVDDRIPAFLQAFRLAVHVVIINSAVGLNLTDVEAEKLAECSLQIESLSREFGKQIKSFRVVSQYLVADILQEFEQTNIHHKVKFHILNSLYALMDLCDKYAIAHLSYALPPASMELFKTIMSSYKKFYRYTGKV